MNCVLFNIVYEHIAATDEFSMRVELKLLARRLLVKMSVLETSSTDFGKYFTCQCRFVYFGVKEL